MDPILDIKFSMYFPSSRGLSYQVLDSILSEIAKTVRKIERKELDFFLRKFSDAQLPQVTRDAIEFRFRQIDVRRHLTISSVRSGSIELTILAAGTAYWVIDKTLGETLKDAWKSSELNRQLIDLLRIRLFQRRNLLDYQFKDQRFKMPEGTQIDWRRSDEIITMTVTTSGEADPIPTTREMFTERRAGDA